MITLRTCLIIGCLCSLVSLASASEPAVSGLPANDPVRNELEVVAKAYQAALRGDEAGTDTHLAASTALDVVPSVLLARRAMTVCGRLQNDNEYARANKVAQRALKRLAGMKESNDKDRTERLYWEALLEGRILDHKAVAVERLEEADKLAPGNEGVLELKREFSAAVARFGR